MKKYGALLLLSMFVLSKWQRVALPTRWRTSVRALLYCYLTFLDHRTNIRRKVRTPRRVSALGEPNKFQNCHLDETNMDITTVHQQRQTAVHGVGTPAVHTLCLETSAGYFSPLLAGAASSLLHFNVAQSYPAPNKYKCKKFNVKINIYFIIYIL